MADRIRASRAAEILAQFGSVSPEAEAIKGLTSGLVQGIDLAGVLAARKAKQQEDQLRLQQLQDKIAEEKRRKEALMKVQKLSTPVTPQRPATTIPLGPEQRPITLGEVATTEVTPQAPPGTILGSTGEEIVPGERQLAMVGPELVKQLELERPEALKGALQEAFPEEIAKRQLAELMPSAKEKREQAKFALDLAKFEQSLTKDEALQNYRKSLLALQSAKLNESNKSKALNQLRQIWTTEPEVFDKPSIIASMLKPFIGDKGVTAGRELAEQIATKANIPLPGSQINFDSVNSIIDAKNRGEIQIGQTVYLNGKPVEVD